jgi:CheY-like chemotaxis protein
METTKLDYADSQSHDVQILVIDDDNHLCELFVETLKQNGFPYALKANSCRDALNLLGLPLGNETHQERKPDISLVIADIVLPDGNGFDLCKKIKMFYPHMPIMLISGHDFLDMHKKISDANADDFMAKPFNMIELITRVNLLLGRKKDITMSLLSQTPLPHPHSRKIPYIGDKVDSYLIIDSIGMGKTTLIYKVLDTRTNEFYALKILSSSSANFEEVIRRFEYEIEIMSQIDHPNVIAFHDQGTYHGATYLVMEYLNGIDLEELLISRGRLAEKVVFAIAFDLACAINEIHDKGIIHRDIKLKNSIYTPATRQVKLCDFGIAQLPNYMGMTQDGLIVGTPIYMSPESFRGDKATIASDIYSYGATIYHLATNTPPFVAENYAILYEQHTFDAPPPIETIRLDFSLLWTELIVDMCLAKEPDQRPKCMTDVLTFLWAIKKGMAK